MRLLILVLGGLLALTLYLFFSDWDRLDWHMSLNGWIAMSLGIVLSLALGGGLMALTFFSARRGYDDQIAPAPPPEPDEPRDP